MNNLAFASIKELRSLLESKKISPHELISFFIQRFKKHDLQIKSALELFDEASIVEHLGNPEGILYGIPGLVKDNICQKGRITSCASRMLESYRPPYDATVVSRLHQAGAVSLGRANMDEFAMGSSTETSAYAKTKNPWNLECVPGGSSGGSVAAVAAGLIPWALGSDTGGSIRQPAAFTNLVGIKPTYGLVSRYGLIAYGSSLDQVGPITRTIYDNALVLSAIAGHDIHDSTSLPVPAPDYTAQLTGKLKPGFTLGIVENALEAEGLDAETYELLQQALAVYERLGAKIKRIKIPMMDQGAACYFIVSRAEAASNLARFDGVKYGHRSKEADSLTDMYAHTRQEGFGLEVQSRILIGNYVLSAGHADQYYNNAKKVQALMRQQFLDAFKDVDLLFAPASAGPAFKFGAFDDNKLQMDLQDYFAAPTNLAGIPSLAIPCGFTTSKLPVGFQLIGPDLSEADLYQAGYAYEQVTDWHKRHPEQFM